MKVLDFLRQSLPVDLGYRDEVTLIEQGPLKEERVLLVGGMGSTWCNPYRPSDDTPYYAHYAAAQIGEYVARCVNHEKFGKCLLLNNALAIPTVWPNYRHEWQPIMTEVFVHEGGLGSENPEWRGSKGCLTIPQPHFDLVMSYFEVNEACEVRIRGTKLYLGLHA